MATQNMFEVLGDEEADASAVIERAAAMEKVKKSQHQDAPKLPSKPLPPAEAVRESKAFEKDSGRGRRGRGRGRGVYGNRDREFNVGSNFPSQGGSQSNEGPDGNEGFRRNNDRYQAGRGRFYNQGRASWLHEEGERGGQSFEDGRGRVREYNALRGLGPRRSRASGENADSYTEGAPDQEKISSAYMKKVVSEEVQGIDDVIQREEGDEVLKEEKDNVFDLPPVEASKRVSETSEDKKVADEEEDNEMLLDDYYKALEEKNKHLKSHKGEERKVEADKEFDKMVMVARKLDEGDFVKLGSDKDKGKKEAAASKDEKLKKNMSINEFLKPPSGEGYSASSGGGRRGGRDGRRRGLDERGGRFRGSGRGFGGTAQHSSAPKIEDPGQFPSLGTK